MYTIHNFFNLYGEHRYDNVSFYIKAEFVPNINNTFKICIVVDKWVIT